jgi:hypothetical protein
MTNLENLEKEKLTIDLVKANLYGILVLIPIAIIYTTPFYLMWKERLSITYFKNQIADLNLSRSAIYIYFSVIIILLLGIIVHELIHGITWSLYTKNGFKSIKFGILLKMLTPYCHCKEPLKVKHYMTGAIMPAIILGFIPAVLSIVLGSVFLLVFGIFFTMAAIGDFMIINLIRKESSNSMVLDHPSEAGCYIYRKK